MLRFSGIAAKLSDIFRSIQDCMWRRIGSKHQWLPHHVSGLFSPTHVSGFCFFFHWILQQFEGFKAHETPHFQVFLPSFYKGCFLPLTVVSKSPHARLVCSNFSQKNPKKRVLRVCSLLGLGVMKSCLCAHKPIKLSFFKNSVTLSGECTHQGKVNRSKTERRPSLNRNEQASPPVARGPEQLSHTSPPT